MDKDGWVTVNRKFTPSVKQHRQDKETEKEANVFSKEEKETNELVKESTEASDLLREERKRKNILKKQRIKEEKKYKREQLARELREIKRRDTKVTVISQAAIDHNNKNVRNQQVNKASELQRPSDTYNPLSNYSTDYPTLQSVSMHEKNKPQTKTRERDIPLNQPYNSSVNENLNTKHASQASLRSSIIPQKPISPIRHNTTVHYEPEINVPDIVPTKRKVRTKDLINLEIMDLIELKKKSEAPKPKPQLQPIPVPAEKIERRGKISEGKKKMTTLKKNQLRQKHNKNDLMAVLSEICLTNENLIKLDENVHEKDEDKNNTQRTPTQNLKEENSLATSKEQIPLIDNSTNSSDATSKEQIPLIDNSTNTSDEPPSGLGEEDKSKAQQDLIKDILDLMNPIHSRKFREYCTHVLSPEIDEVLREMIEMIVMFHQRLYHQDPTKAKMRRRFYCGLKEAVKHMNKVTCLVMAPNLKPSPGKGCLDELVNKVLSCALEHGVPVVFGLTDRVLGRITHRKVPTSCISLVNVQGAQDKFKKLKELVATATHQYDALIKRHATNVTVQKQGQLESPLEKRNHEESPPGKRGLTESPSSKDST